MTNAAIDKINKHRTKFQDKARLQLEEVMMASLDGNKPAFDAAVHELATNLLILRRFDDKLIGVGGRRESGE